MRFKLKSKNIKQAFKITRKLAPIALTVVENAFPASKTIKTATKFGKAFL